MPRNASGIYTLPGGNPVTPGDVIEASWANTTLEDVADALTNSLSRTGAGGMLAPFRIADGNISAPGLSYLNETNTGLYRSGSGSTWMAVLGVNVAQFSTVGLTIASAKALTALGNASVGGTLSVTGATTLASTLAVTGAITATGGVLGNITAGSGTSTFNNVVINGNLDMDAGSSGTITNLPNPTNPGDAANKAYVDSQDALRLALTGGTMTGAIAMSNNKVTGVATPTADQDAANKAYVDNVAQGIDAKASCKAATTANITLSGNQTIDGVAVVAGDRVLVKNQSSAAQNGIYVADSSTWSRSSDANTWDELVAAFTFVEQGTENGNNGYICTIAPGGTLGVTAVTWAQFSGAGQIIAGQGLSKTGNTIQVNTASSSRIVIGADDIDLATTGVVADTYKSVSVDAYGRVTAGTNPTTLAGFGIGDAYTQTQTNSLLAAKLSLAGGTMSGAIAMGTNKITGLGDPTTAQDAATKNYIDTIFGSTTTAAASAAAAAASASAASTSATNAASSATAAAGSATSAAASATSAAASYDAFDDRYLGAKASDPTVDNDGNPLLTGALYWNTTSNVMKVYNGSAWEAAYLPGSGYALLAAANTFTANQIITANTSSAALSITQTGSGNALYIEDVAADATPFVVSSTGAVGIGTTTPDNVTSAGIALVSNDGYYPQVVNRNKSNDATASYLVFDKDRAGAIVQSGDALGAIVWRSFDGSNYLQSSAIIGYSDGTPGTNDVPGSLVFFTTADGASSPTERLRISSTGAGTATADWTFNGVKVGRGAGAVATNTAVGASALAGSNTGGYNTAVGLSTLAANTSGAFQTALGWSALLANTTGTANTALGAATLYANTTGSNNLAVGSASSGNSPLQANTTGSFNTALGNNALASNTTSSSNTAVGYQSLYSNTTGTSSNEAFGREALRTNTTGGFNQAFGNSALYYNTTGSYNVAMGTGSLQSNTTASNNTAVGYQALYSSTTGTGSNAALGYQAGYTNSTGYGNVYIGDRAGQLNTTYQYNTFVGATTGQNANGGTFNSFFGAGAGYLVTTGSKNTIIGAYNGNQGGLDIRTASNYIVLSDGDGNPRGLFDSSGRFLVGLTAYTTSSSQSGEIYSTAAVGFMFTNSTAANYPISIKNEGTSGTRRLINFYEGTGGGTARANISFDGSNNFTIVDGGSGGVYLASGGTSWTAVSDERKKDIIEPISDAVNKVSTLRAVIGKYKNDEEGVRRSFLIAQDVKAVLPEAVNTYTEENDETEYLGLSYTEVIPLLVASIKELKSELDSVKAELATLKGN